MKKQLDTAELITELQGIVSEQLLRTSELEQLDMKLLAQRPKPDAWSVLEILEHLNISSGHYLHRLDRAYSDNSRRMVYRSEFIPGRWGEKLSNDMRPKADGSVNKPMRTLWFFEPKAARTKGIKSLIEFRALLEDQRDLLELACTKGLEGPLVTSTLGPIFRFKVGDAFRFSIAHQQRHFAQIERALRMITEREKAVQQ